MSAYANRSQDHKAEREAKLVRRRKRPKPTSRSAHESMQCRSGRRTVEAGHHAAIGLPERTTCIVCMQNHVGATCPNCEKQDRRSAKRIAAVAHLLRDGEPHDWDEVVRAARGTGMPLDECEQDGLDAALGEDGRFIQKRKRWLLKSQARSPSRRMNPRG